MLGGLYKKTTYLNNYRKKQKNLIVVDSGDLLNEHLQIKDSFMKSARLKGDLIAKVYKGIGIDAIDVGELDLALGLNYLKGLEKKYDTPFVSANIVNDKNQLQFKPYVIKKMGNFKVGIIGIMGNSYDLTSKLKQVSGGTLSVLDPLKATKAAIADLKNKKVNFIIVLAHENMGRNWVIARRTKGINVIVGGHPTQKLKVPYKANDTYIVQSGEKGQYQGMLNVTIASNGSETVQNSLVPIGDKIPDNPKVKEMIDQFNNRVTKIYATKQKNKGKKVPLRAESCKKCHSKAYAIWKKSAHARAYQALVNKGRQFNPDCLACHTTRFEKPGGFTMNAQQKSLRNVQCGSCHGDLMAHAKKPDIIPKFKPGKATCLKCHTPEKAPGFAKNFKKKWKLIKH